MSHSHNDSGDTPEELYTQGIACLRCQSWKEAVATFKKLAHSDPGYKDVWQRLDEAKKKAREFEDREDLYSMGRVHLEKEHWQAAIDCLKCIVDSGAEYRDAAVLLEEAERQLRLQNLYAEAVVQLDEEKWEEAIEALEKIARIDQAYKDSYAKLGEARVRCRLQNLYQQVLRHFRKERWPQAIGDLNTILQEDPNYPGAADKLKEAQKQQELATLYSNAVGFQQTGSWEEAIATFTEIIQRAGVYKDVAARLNQVQRRQRLDRDHSGRITLTEFLRDPMMQGIGVIVALITLIVAVYSLVHGMFPSPGMSTGTPSPTDLTPFPTPISHTRVPSPTFTPIPTSTPTPTCTPTFTPIPPSPTPSPSPTSTPTRTPTDTPIPPTRTPAYPAPVLIGAQRTTGCNWKFEWQWSRTLDEDEYFAIRVGVDSPGESKEWIKEAWYEYPLTDAGGRYVWEVAICRGDPSTHICEQLAVSEQQSFSFTCSPTKPTPTRRLRQ